jgi:hypothetical protein
MPFLPSFSLRVGPKDVQLAIQAENVVTVHTLFASLQGLARNILLNTVHPCSILSETLIIIAISQN